MKLYTVSQAAKELGINRNQVYKYINSKELKATKIGSLKIKSEWLDEFVERNMV